MTRLCLAAGASALALLLACGPKVDETAPGGAAGGGQPSTSSAPSSSSGGPSCSQAAACPILGDAAAFGGDVAWSLAVAAAAPASGAGYAQVSLIGDDAAGGWLFDVGERPASCGLAKGTLHVDGAGAATSVKVPTDAFAIVAAPSSDGLFYVVESRRVRLLSADGTERWSRPHDPAARYVASGAAGVVVHGQTTVESWAPDGTPRISKSSPTADCTPAPKEHGCPSVVAGVAVLADGAVALSGTSTADAPYDFGSGPLAGPFLVVVEPTGDVRFTTSVPSALIRDLTVDDAGRLVVVGGDLAQDVYIYDDHGAYLQGCSVEGSRIRGTDAMGAPLWQLTIDIEQPIPLVAGDHALLADNQGRFLGFDVTTGVVERDEQLTLPADAVPTAPDIEGVDSVAMARDGRVAFLATSPSACAHGCGQESGERLIAHTYVVGLGPLHCSP